jgi:nicotinamidase/pyrazinamidase
MAEIIVVGPNDAFLVIDMNSDFLNPTGKLFVRGITGEPGPEELVKRILWLNNLPFGYRIMVSEMHSPDHLEFIHYPIHAIKDTGGQRWPEELLEMYDKADFRLVKGMEPEIMSAPIYAGKDFFQLIRSLRAADIKRIFIAGLAYDQCLGEAAIALSHQHFEAIIVRNATRSVPPPRGRVETMKQILRLYGIKEVKSSCFRF